MYVLHFRCYVLIANIDKLYAKTAKTGEIPEANHFGIISTLSGKAILEVRTTGQRRVHVICY